MRFLTAGNFIFACLIFFLPWLDVRCDTKEFGTRSLFSQSGYQTAVGEYSLGSALRDMPGGKGGDPIQERGIKGGEEGAKSPLMWGYLAALGVGALVCLLVPIKQWRVIALVCVIVAVGILGTQTAMGFPLDKKMTEEMEKDKKAGANPGMKIYVAYDFGFYLAWLSSLTPLALIALGGAKPKKSRNRFARDDRDDDERPPQDNPFS